MVLRGGTTGRRGAPGPSARPKRANHEDRRKRPTNHVPAVVPKGLRSFDANDSDFFLQLLPGARDKNGLPESIRFWKHRIETTDEPTFTVGVIYGPSGCGKSSLVKAGLLPRLSEKVISVYIEATPDETEARLLNGLRRRFPGLPDDLDLTQMIAALCQRHGFEHRPKGGDRPRPVRAVAACQADGAGHGTWPGPSAVRRRARPVHRDGAGRLLGRLEPVHERSADRAPPGSEHRPGRSVRPATRPKGA